MPAKHAPPTEDGDEGNGAAATGTTFSLGDLPLPGLRSQQQAVLTPGLTAGMTVEKAEQELIRITLQHTGGNKTRAAELLGISLKTLHNKLNKLRLRPKRTE